MAGKLRAALCGALLSLSGGSALADQVHLATFTRIAAGAVALPSPSPAQRMPRDPGAGLLAPLGQRAQPVRGDLPVDGAGPGLADAYGPFGLPCAARLEALPAPGATVVLKLEAPCLAERPVEFAHGALSATFRTGKDGIVEAVFPAFASEAEYRARLPGGSELRALATVPGAEGYERVATMWTGAEGLAVHAFEYGASVGAVGHVWRGAPRDAGIAEAGRGGYLLRLGNTAADPGFRQAEVYSFPAAQAVRPGAVRFALGAAVTEATCGRELTVSTLQIGRDLPGAAVEVTLAMPDCDRRDGYLMLKNLARDLKIAAD